MELNKLSKLDPRIPIWDGLEFEKRPCPFCSCDDSKDYVFRPDNLLVTKCKSCECFYIKHAPTTESLGAFYKNYSRDHYQKEIVKFSRKPDPNSLANSYPIQKLKHKLGGSWKNKKILDFGCGRGELVTHLNSLGASATGIDIDEISKESAILNSFDFYQKLSDLPEGSLFDAVILFDFVEHPIDIKEILKDIRDYMTDDGYLLIWTPSAINVDIKNLDSLSVFRYTLEHMQYLSSKTCLEIGRILRFDIVHMETRGFPTSVDEYERSNIFVIKSLIKSAIKKLIPKSIQLNRLSRINDLDAAGNYHLFLIYKNR